MIKKVFFIRHGEVEYPRNKKGEELVYGPLTPLSELGKRQISSLGREFKKNKIRIQMIFSSPYLRTKQSAKEFKNQLDNKLPLVFIKELRDVDNFGWHGATMKEYGKISGDVYSYPLAKNDETLEQLSTRAFNVVKKIITTKYQSFAVVSHGDFLRALIWTLKHKKAPPNYHEMKKFFYLEKGQAIEYKIDKSLKSVKRLRVITIEDVKKSIEYWRK